MKKYLFIFLMLAALPVGLYISSLSTNYYTAAYNVSVTRIAEQQLIAAECQIALLQVIALLLIVSLVVGGFYATKEIE